jgi:ubiquinone biosynthesis protein
MYYSTLGKHTVNAVRLAEVLQVMARHGFADLLRRAGFEDGLPARVLRGLNLMTAESGEPSTFGKRLRAAMVDLGPTYVKFGQILSTRPDLISHSVAEELSDLQDKVEPSAFDVMAEVIEETLGNTVDEVFESFDKTPVASASLSQVYRATLKTGEAVAVKVQRPGVEKTIESDLSLLRQIAEWSGDHVGEMKTFDPPGIVDEFARSIRRELDFNIEASVIEQFRKNFAETDNVFIPRVYPDFSAKRVLTMDWVDGVPVDQTDAYEERRCDPSAVAVRGCDLLCQMIFEHQLFHADPHPGNVFITWDNQIAFIDLGMAGHLERTDVAAIADIFVAMYQEDSAECANALLTLTTKGEPDDRSGLEYALAEFITFEAQAILGGGQVTHGLERATQILRRFDLELAPRFSLLLKALATIEMLGRQLDPKMNMVAVFEPYVKKLLQARYQPTHMMKEAKQNASALFRLSRQIPGDLSYLLQQLRRGKLQFQIHHEHLENLAGTIDRASSRNTAGMIIGSLIVGSSLLITTESQISYLGIAGFVIAGVFGLGLVVSILWSRKF